MKEQIEDLIQEWTEQNDSDNHHRADMKNNKEVVAKIDGVILGRKRCIADLQKMLNENMKP